MSFSSGWLECAECMPRCHACAGVYVVTADCVFQNLLLMPSCCFVFFCSLWLLLCLCCIVSHRTKEPAYIYLNFNYSACLTLSVSLFRNISFLLVFVRLSGVPLVTVDDLIAQENSEVPIGNDVNTFRIMLTVMYSCI